jgi:hypothetical protein
VVYIPVVTAVSLFENKVLSIFCRRKEDRTEGWRKLHSGELHSFCFSLHIRGIMSRRMRWAGHVAHMVMRNVYKILVGKPEGKRLLRRLKYRWKDNIKMHLRETGFKDVNFVLNC